MKVKTDDLSTKIAKEVTRMLLPKVKRIVREEVEYNMNKILNEYSKGRKNLNSVVDFNEVVEQERPQKQQNTASQEKSVNDIVLERKKLAREKLHGYYDSNDPFADMIANAEDPQELERIKEETQVNNKKDRKKLSEATADELLDPLNLDFSENVSAMESR
jgi:hypothetical protein